MDRIDVRDAPDVPGLTFRRFRGADDYAVLAAVREGVREYDRIDPRSPREGIPSVDDMARVYDDVSPGSPNMLVVEVDGAVVGYNWVTWWEEQDGPWLYLHLGWLLPAWRGQGIGTAMLRAAERRLRAVAARRRAYEGVSLERQAFGTNASSTEREATSLALREGYTLFHSLSDMAVRVEGDPDALFPRAALPAGVDARPVAPGDYRAIYDAWKDAWAGLPLMRPPGEEDYRDFLADNVDAPGFDPSLWQVAWRGDEVVGVVVGRVWRGVGVVPEVAVRRRWRRRGVARALLLGGMRALAGRGVPEIRIITDRDDSQGARSLYESAGFREFKWHGLYRKPMDE